MSFGNFTDISEAFSAARYSEASDGEIPTGSISSASDFSTIKSLVITQMQ